MQSGSFFSDYESLGIRLFATLLCALYDCDIMLHDLSFFFFLLYISFIFPLSSVIIAIIVLIL